MIHDRDKPHKHRPIQFHKHFTGKITLKSRFPGVQKMRNYENSA